MKKKTLIIFLALLSIKGYSETLTLNLEETIKLAKEEDKEIKQAEISLENYKLQKEQAFKSALPELSYVGSTNKIESNDDLVNKYYLEISQTLFDGFKTQIAIKNSKQYLEKGGLELEDKKNEIAMEVINTYITLNKYEKEFKILEKSKEIIEKQYQKISEKYKLGLAKKTEVLNLSYSLIELDTEMIKKNNNIETTKINLENSLGIAEGTDFQLDEIKFTEIDIESIDLNGDIAKALDDSIEIKIQKLSTELIKASETTAKAEFYPSVNLAFDYGNINSVTGDLSESFKSENVAWSVGVNISGSIFSWGKNKDAYKEAKNNTRNAEYSEQIKEEEIELNMKSQYLELIRLKKLEVANEKALESSKENYELQEKSYENSLISSTDYLEAEYDMRNAELNLIETKLDLFYAYEVYKNYLR